MSARRGAARVVLLALVTTAGLVVGALAPAAAQMPDPSAMSGLPRPDSTVPSGKLVVRVIRGDFAHPMVGTTVMLEGPGGKKSGPVGDDGRASFEGLSSEGLYTVKASAGSETVTSQPIRLPEEVGVKVMLVFKADGSPPPPPAAPTSSGSSSASPSGPALSSDASGLSISRKSHLIIDVKDEAVEVVENLFLSNSGAGPIDPGKEGLVFPLPEGAHSAQTIGQATAGLVVAGDRAVLQGPIRTGETALSFGLVISQHGDGIELRQTLPVKMEQLVAITSDFPGMEVHGDGLTTTPRELGGRKFLIINGGPVEKGGQIHLTLAGLPHRSQTSTYLAVLMAALVGLWGLWTAFGPRATVPTSERSRLEVEKKSLLDELAALERNKAGTAKAEAKHVRRASDLTEKLEQVMRELDDYAD